MHILKFPEKTKTEQQFPRSLLRGVDADVFFPAHIRPPFDRPAACAIADIASVKGLLSEYYKSCGFPFVSIHPMFGPRFANMNKIQGENIIFINESGLETICMNMEFLKQVIRAQDREEVGKLLARLRRNIQPHIS